MAYRIKLNSITRGKNKYNAKTTEYKGLKYDSQREARYAAELDLLKRAGEIKEWERQVKIDLKVNGIHICNYFCDFRVITKAGIVQYHEVKGFVTELWRLKWKIFEATINEIDPGAELIVIK